MLHRALAVLLAASSLTLVAVAATPGTAAPAARGGQATADGPVLPDRFEEEVVVDGLDEPTAVDFAPDGSIFVGEKGGLVKWFSGAGAEPVVFADLNEQVHSLYDRGLLGLAVDPGFPARPYVYVLHAYDHILGGSEPAPHWGVPGVHYDDCPDPAEGGPGAEDMGCLASGRLSRLTAEAAPGGGWRAAAEDVLLEDWCMQYPSHSTGSVHVGPDGHLWASAGEGAHYLETDHGQLGAPYWPGGNACDDPVGEGGSLRSQDVRTSGDLTGLGGTLVRVDIDTAEGVPGNPLTGRGNANERRIVAHGFRNPFRFAFRPGTGTTDPEVWVGDVGAGAWEELDVLRPGGSRPDNFGWPCHEGPSRNPAFDALDLPLCESLYRDRSATRPYWSYPREGTIADESCPYGSSSISGVQFAASPTYPAGYAGALFFSDYSRGCIWVVPPGADGRPDTSGVRAFAEGVESPVDLLTGPEGDLHYVSLGIDEQGYPVPGAGSVRRIRYVVGNRSPVAEVTADRTWGPAPLSVQLDAGGSTDPEGAPLTYAWDLDGDGDLDDATGPQARTTVGGDRDVAVRVRVSDPAGAAGTATLVLHPGDLGPPVLEVTAPAAGLRWSVGDLVRLAATAIDPDGSEPSVGWQVSLAHCPADVCHTHLLAGDLPARSSFRAPDHEHPSRLLVRVRATDARGLSSTESFRLDPAVVRRTFRTSPRGLRLVVGEDAHRGTWRGTFVAGSRVTVTAPRHQRRSGHRLVFRRWSDGGARSHAVTVLPGAGPLTAVYRRVRPQA